MQYPTYLILMFIAKKLLMVLKLQQKVYVNSNILQGCNVKILSFTIIDEVKANVQNVNIRFHILSHVTVKPVLLQ